jgi:hypothetical protein
MAKMLVNSDCTNQNDIDVLKSMIVLLVGDIQSYNRSAYSFKFDEIQNKLSNDVANISMNCLALVRNELPGIPEFMLVNSESCQSVSSVLGKFHESAHFHLDEISKINSLMKEPERVKPAISAVADEIEQVIQNLDQSIEHGFIDSELYHGSWGALRLLQDMDSESGVCNSEVSTLNKYFECGECLTRDLLDTYKKMWDGYIFCLDDVTDALAELESLDYLRDLVDISDFPEVDGKSRLEMEDHIKSLYSCVKELKNGLNARKVAAKKERENFCTSC